MAFRGYLDDLEREEQTMHYYMTGMVGIMRSNGADKVKVPPKPKPLRRRPEQLVTPSLNAVLKTLGGNGTVIENG